MGVAGKGIHLVARNNYVETFLGGAFIVSNHLASFTPNVTLVTSIGETSELEIESQLNPLIEKKLTSIKNTETLVKRRYVQKDGNTLTKLFETYSSKENSLDENQTNQLVEYLEKNGRTLT